MQVYLFCAVSRLLAALPLPASLVGMILMLALIVCRILPLQWVRAGRVGYWPKCCCFVPAVVAVVNYAQYWWMAGVFLL
ncbi:MAG: CidA/LrgA family protein [Escherichia coli]